jgi:hypothetical protein
MVKGLDLFSKRAIAESGIGDDVDAEAALEPPPIPEEAVEDWEEMADRPDAPFVEKTELVDLDDEASAPGVVDDRTDAPVEPDRLDRCDPDIPLVDETESVVTEGVRLLEDVRLDVEAGTEGAPVGDEELWR